MDRTTMRCVSESDMSCVVVSTLSFKGCGGMRCVGRGRVSRVVELRCDGLEPAAGTPCTRRHPTQLNASHTKYESASESASGPTQLNPSQLNSTHFNPS